MPIKLEAGKRYMRRDGLGVHDIFGDILDHEVYPFESAVEGSTYTEDGHVLDGEENAGDLIAEVPAGTVLVPVVEGSRLWADHKVARGEEVQMFAITKWVPYDIAWEDGTQFRIKPEPQPVAWKEAEAWMDEGGECSWGIRRYKICGGVLYVWECGNREKWRTSELTYNALKGLQYVLLEKTPEQVEGEG